MRRRLAFLLAILMGALAAGGVGGADPSRDAATTAPDPGPARLAGAVAAALRQAPDAPLDVLLSLERPADDGLKAALAAVGTWSAAFKHVPVAAVRLPAARLLGELRALPGVQSIHPNELLPLSLAEAATAMNVTPVRQKLGLTGKGVTVAIIDAGFDFTHPDLAPAMKANLKLSGFGEGDDSPLPIPVPVLQLPHTDLTSGHGTHVAGDVASRGVASDGKYQGMAPGAGLIGLAAGEGVNVSVFAVIEGFDWIVEHKDEYGIRIVNNSYGSAFSPYDPEDPITKASKTAADAGIAVFFAYGNDGGEMSANRQALAPWVIGVAGGTKTNTIAQFSSGGVEPDQMGTGFDKTDVRGETRRPLAMGLYHPSITATGEGIVSTRATGSPLPFLSAPDDAKLPPQEAARYTHMSGTSMASPIAVGIGALVLEANPTLTSEELRRVLQTTARPIPGTPFHKQGYGALDAEAAVRLAQSLKPLGPAETARRLEERQIARDAEVLAGLDHPTRTWAWTRSESGDDEKTEEQEEVITHTIEVPAGTARVRAQSSPLSTTPVGAQATIALLDAAGAQVAKAGYVVASENVITLDLDLHQLANEEGAMPLPYEKLAFGTWTLRFDAPGGLEVATVAATYDTVPAAPCALPSPVPLTLRMQDDTAAAIAPYPAQDGFSFVGPVPSGRLGTRAPERRLAGAFNPRSATITADPVFVSDPLPEGVDLNGNGQAQLFFQPTGVPTKGVVRAFLLEVGPDGQSRLLAEGQGDVAIKDNLTEVKPTVVPLTLKAYTVPAGHRLAVGFIITSVGSIGDVLLYDSDKFPSGITLPTGHFAAGCVPAVAPEDLGPILRVPGR